MRWAWPSAPVPGALLLFHHDPPRTDDDIDAIVAGYAGSPVPVAGAVEGAVFDLPGTPGP